MPPLVILALLMSAPGSQAAAPAGSFVVSTWTIGLSGGRDEDYQAGNGSSWLDSKSTLGQLDYAVDDSGRERTRTFNGEAKAKAGATYVFASSWSSALGVADPGVGTVGGGGDSFARASAQVPFRIDAPGLAGTFGVMRVPILVSYGVNAGSPVPLGPHAPWPGSSSGNTQVRADLSGTVSPPGGSCSGFDYCRYMALATGVADVVSGTGLPSVSTMEIGFRFGQWNSYYLSVDSRSGVSVNAVTTSLAPDRASVFNDTASFVALRWGGIQQVLTQTGLPVDQWSVESLPGVELSVAGVVPEPGAWALLLAGLGALAMRFRRRASDA
jgi:hypothetical protein